jgi:hypothetical protein
VNSSQHERKKKTNCTPTFPEMEENEIYTGLIPQDHTKMIPKTSE